MIIEELALRNWRGFREPHHFRFNAGLNLLVGNNEAGKSTIFETLACLIFDSHNGRRREIAAMQPLGSSLSPEADMVFSTGSSRYKVHKRFLDHPQSRLYVARANGWDLEHEGDRADEQLRDVLGGQRSSRVLRPEHRGLAQALWYLQRDQPLPEETWDEAVRQGLSGLVAAVASSPAEQRMMEIMERLYGECFTPTGRERAGSELARVREEVADLQRELSRLAEKATATASLRTELEDLSVRYGRKAADLAQRQAQLPELAAGLEAAGTKEQRLRIEEGRLEVSRGEAAKHDAVLKRVHRRVEQCREEDGALGDLLRQADKLQEQQQNKKAEEGREHREWKDVLEPELKQIEARLSRLTDLERLRGQIQEDERLTKAAQEQSELSEKIADQEQALGELLALSEREWGEFAERQRALEDARGKRQVAAIRVTFESDDPGVRIESQPETEGTAGEQGIEYLVSRATVFMVPGFGRVGVRGGGESLAELDEKVRELEGHVQETLRRFAVRDVQELSDRHLERLSREGQKALLEKSLQDARQREPRVQERLVEIRREHRETEQRLAGVLVEEVGWDITHLREELERGGNRKQGLIQAIGEAQKREETARAAAEGLERERHQCLNRITELRSRIRSWERENGEDLTPYGDLSQLEQQAEKSQREKEQLERDIEERREAYREQVEEPRLLHRQAVDAIQDLEKQLSDLKHEMVDRRARIEATVAEGFYTRQAEVEQKLADKQQRLADLIRRGAGTRLLRELMQIYQKERSTALTAPVGRLLNPWLTTLSGGAYDRIDLSDQLLPQALYSTRYMAEFPIESLSYGTHEQLVVLLRLSLGWLLSSDERQLVVLDDRLVNADPVRMRRFNLILREAAQRMQILLATCDDTPYAGIGGTIIHVPEDGKIRADG